MPVKISMHIHHHGTVQYLSGNFLGFYPVGKVLAIFHINLFIKITQELFSVTRLRKCNCASSETFLQLVWIDNFGSERSSHRKKIHNLLFCFDLFRLTICLIISLAFTTKLWTKTSIIKLKSVIKSVSLLYPS